MNGATVRTLHAAGRQQVVASGSPRDRVDVCLEKADVSEIFQPDRVFTREDVEKGKPEPDMFLKAAAFCEADPKIVWWSEGLDGRYKSGRSGGHGVRRVPGRRPRAEAVVRGGCSAIHAGPVVYSSYERLGSSSEDGR